MLSDHVPMMKSHSGRVDEEAYVNRAHIRPSARRFEAYLAASPGFTRLAIGRRYLFPDHTHLLDLRRGI